MTGTAASMSERATIDEQRAQEHYQYSNALSSRATPPSPTPKPETMVASQAQLLCHHLNFKRTSVALVDRETQHFLAETTTDMNLPQSTDFAHALPMLWGENGSIPIFQRPLCEATLLATPGADGRPAHVEVVDMAEDDRTKDLPLVKDLRYYCGFPLKTKKGISIGSICALDDAPREPLSEDELEYFRIIADNIMTTLEAARERVDVCRIKGMNTALAEFVDPYSPFHRGLTPMPSTGTIPLLSTAGLGSPDVSQKDSLTKAHAVIVRKEGVSSTKGQDHNKQGSGAQNVTEDATKSHQSPQSPPTVTAHEDDHLAIFARAANMLCRSLDLGEGGRVLFLDTVPQSSADCSSAAGDRPDSTGQVNERRHSAASIKTNKGAAETNRQHHSTKAAATLANSSIEAGADPLESLADIRIPLRELQRLIERHTTGKLYSFADVASFPDHVGMDPEEALEATEFTMLSRSMPNTKHILFVPLWNSHSSRWAVCLACATSDGRTFSHEIDYLYARAFCNCVQSDIGRLSILVADQQKAAFIGSVSHELRSPLHGILAACEFLADTECSAFQTTLVDTAKSCAHTLLDTIDMVLDHSKISVFARDGKDVKRASDDSSRGIRGPTDPMSNLCSSVDIAVIFEEVIEGIATGHLARTASNMRFNDAGRGISPFTKNSPPPGDLTSPPPVEIIIDLAPMQDWHFVTQPGAFRRVLMNLFGNALKYTEKGFVRVMLRTRPFEHGPGTPEPEPDAPKETTFIQLIVQDSGRGISQEYIRTKLYTAFAQENTLAAGTGLGLSLVKSIVTMLNGTINVESEVGRGTTFTVCFPMLRDAFATISPSQSLNDQDIKDLRELRPGPQAAVFQQSQPEDGHCRPEWSKQLWSSLAHYITEWFEMPPLRDWDPKQHTDILCVDEMHLPLVAEVSKLVEANPTVVVFCSDASRSAMLTKISEYKHLNVVCKPFGPRKLARVFRAALEGRGEPRVLSHLPAIVQPLPVEPGQLATSSGDQKGSSLAYRLGSNELRSHATHAKLVPPPTESDKGYPFPQMSITPNESSPVTSPGLSTISLPRTETSHMRHPSLGTVLESSTQGERPQTGRSKSESHASRPGPQPRVLVVDDNEVNLRLLHTYLVKRYYSFISLAKDGSQAVQAYKTAMENGTPPDIVFMDIQMPIMDGFEATKHIRMLETEEKAKQENDEVVAALNLPVHRALIVALTGVATGQDQSNAFSNGFSLYMTKPVSFKVVGRLLDEWESEHREPDFVVVDTGADPRGV